MDYKVKIQQSIDYIEANLCEKIKLNDLARQSYFSEFHFHRLFRNIVGETTMGYVRKRRLSEAAIDLLKTKVKITEIALKYQFSSEEAFSRAFKETYGITPREYRKIKKDFALFKKVNLFDKVTKSHASGEPALNMVA